ncbi:hypothetical protein DFQ04_3117 [Algoriphagus boseongensis]|uniref:CHAD domain-containing protein n=1 Tax=Algoriphagus boseongensis TaxID=1442587 RepID=A0A4R6T1Z7_9BACT|nr:hypothetical protein [Algoriphagus boseongensis]TDQ15230.1 hypothetical protein DFQ04_3117 [Algoriphagus boseongensis]
MQAKTSPVFQIFEQQHQEARALFLVLGKQIKSKKAIELLGKLEFLELYADLLSKIYFGKENLGTNLFSPFKKLKRSLRVIQHLKLVEKSIQEKTTLSAVKMDSFSDYLLSQKRKGQKDAFDLMVGSPLKIWEDLLDKTYESSKGIKPLMISTAINQLVQEELEFLHQDIRTPLSTQAFSQLFESLRRIIMLENFLVHLGFNPIFINQIHQEIQSLKENLKPWYTNHLTLQALSAFLAERENPSKKYLDWAKELRVEKKGLSSQIEKQAIQLLQKISS